MELRHLRYFVAVADEGHMTRAAAVLGIQQPPLSQQIKALEAAVGLPLFTRHAKGVRLTAAGEVFLPEARRILADAEALARRMSLLAEGARGVLRVGFTSSAAAHAFTPQALRMLRERHPDIALQLREGNAADVIDLLATAQLHCAVLRVPVARPPGIVFETLLDEPALVALPVGHPLARPEVAGAPLMLTALRGQRVILVRRPNAPGLYADFLSACARQGVTLDVVAEVDRMMTNLNLVASGVGLSVVPASMRGVHARSVVYRALDDAVSLHAPITLAYRAADVAGGVARFVEVLREVAMAERRAARARAIRKPRAASGWPA